MHLIFSTVCDGKLRGQCTSREADLVLRLRAAVANLLVYVGCQVEQLIDVTRLQLTAVHLCCGTQVEQLIDVTRLREEINFLTKNLKMKHKWLALERDVIPDSPAGEALERDVTPDSPAGKTLCWSLPCMYVYIYM